MQNTVIVVLLRLCVTVGFDITMEDTVSIYVDLNFVLADMFGVE